MNPQFRSLFDYEVHPGLLWNSLDKGNTGEGIFSKRRGIEKMEGVPVLWSYAFAEGKRRGLILLNIDTSEPHPVTIAFDGTVRGGKATRWSLTAASIAAGNEFEQPQPQVKLLEREIAGFASGHRLTLPAHSACALEWEVR